MSQVEVIYISISPLFDIIWQETQAEIYKTDFKVTGKIMCHMFNLNLFHKLYPVTFRYEIIAAKLKKYINF
jgi:hypothetical protein